MFDLAVEMNLVVAGLFQPYEFKRLAQRTCSRIKGRFASSFVRASNHAAPHARETVVGPQHRSAPRPYLARRGQTILLERERIKRKTIEHRRLHHRKNAAYDQSDAPEPLLFQAAICLESSDDGQ